MTWFTNYTDSIAALEAGKLDANSQTLSDAMPALAKGTALKIVLVNDNSAGNDALMVNSKINSIADLKGKRIALEQFTVSHFLLATALSKNGLKLSDVALVNLPAADAAAALIAGRADAAALWNPWVNQVLTSGKGQVVFTSKDMPGLIPDVLVAQEKSVKDKRKEFVGMIRAWYDTEKFIREHRDEAIQIMAKAVKSTPEDYKIVLLGTRFFNERDNLNAFGPASKARSLAGAAPAIAQFLKDNKLLEGNLEISRGLDGSLVAEVAQN